MRNPWGSMEWIGEWGDDCENWTSEIKQKLNYDPKYYDGTFWISLQNFYKHFNRLCCCKIRPHYIYKSVQFRQNPFDNISLAKIHLTKKSYAYFSVIQKSKRHFKARKEAGYDYSTNRFMICKMDDKLNYVQYELGKSYDKQSNTCEAMLEPGYYFVLCYFEWRQQYHNDFVLTAYSENEIDISEISGDNVNRLDHLRSMIKCYIAKHDDQSGSIQDYTAQGGENIYKHSGKALGLDFILYKNLSTDTILTETVVIQTEGYVFIYEDMSVYNDITLTLRPGEEKLFVIKNHKPEINKQTGSLLSMKSEYKFAKV